MFFSSRSNGLCIHWWKNNCLAGLVIKYVKFYIMFSNYFFLLVLSSVTGQWIGAISFGIGVSWFVEKLRMLRSSISTVPFAISLKVWVILTLLYMIQNYKNTLWQANVIIGWKRWTLWQDVDADVMWLGRPTKSAHFFLYILLFISSLKQENISPTQ